MLTKLSWVLVTPPSVSINSTFSFVLGRNVDDDTDKKMTMIQKKINNRPRQQLKFETQKMSSTKEYYSFALAD
jgi:hypothetical protein